MCILNYITKRILFLLTGIIKLQSIFLWFWSGGGAEMRRGPQNHDYYDSSSKIWARRRRNFQIYMSFWYIFMWFVCRSWEDISVKSSQAVLTPISCKKLIYFLNFKKSKKKSVQKSVIFIKNEKWTEEKLYWDQFLFLENVWYINVITMTREGIRACFRNLGVRGGGAIIVCLFVCCYV